GLCAFEQRSHSDADNAWPGGEVFAGTPRMNGCIQVLVRCGARGDVHGDRTRSAHALELVILEYSQEFGLEFWLGIADLVEEDCAALRQFQQALFLLVCSGKRSFLMAEQLGLK